MSEVAFGRTVRLVTERATTRGEFRIGLEAVEKATGRLSFDPDVQYEGDGIRFRSGDVLFGKLRPNLRKAWLADKSGDAVGDFHVYRPVPDRMSSRYLAYLVLSEPFLEPVIASVYGAKMPRADWGDIRTTKVWVPGLPEQRAISDYLDRETAQIDAFIAKNEELINLLIERRSAVASQAMYRGFQDVAVRHMVQLIQTGPFGSQLHAEDYVPGGHPLINPMHMIDGRAVPSSDVAISDDKADELRRHALRTDDLVVARRGELGRSALITPDQIGFLCGTGSMLIRPDSRRVVARYLQLAIGSERSRSTLREQSVGSTMENLNAGALSALRVPLPPIETQHEILHELDVANARIEAALTTARRSTDLARERRAALISAAVTGKIDAGVAA
ncbi:restriction endonuclease subunit S [Microbacterium aurum]|uniref:restriction endonuclease subunit S n=1 Tax=Microbacterium aurum TaxID=36805 RepID=UPI00248D6932|nr:restriction endonuclease subunit S [Microbacterium aurum]